MGHQEVFKLDLKYCDDSYLLNYCLIEFFMSPIPAWEGSIFERTLFDCTIFVEEWRTFLSLNRLSYRLFHLVSIYYSTVGSIKVNIYSEDFVTSHISRTYSIKPDSFKEKQPIVTYQRPVLCSSPIPPNTRNPQQRQETDDFIIKLWRWTDTPNFAPLDYITS